MALFQQQLGCSGLSEELTRSERGASPRMGHERDRAGPGGAGRGWAGRVGVAQAVVAVNSDFRQVHRLKIER